MRSAEPSLGDSSCVEIGTLTGRVFLYYITDRTQLSNDSNLAARLLLDRIAAEQAAGDDSHIDFSDIPELSDEQLARMVRRPPPKEVLSFRIDADVAAWLRSFPGGYSARANAILRAVMERQGGSANA